MQAGYAYRGWTKAGLAATGMAGIMLVAGCGTAAAMGAGSPVTLATARHSGPPAGTRAQAAKLAMTELGRGKLPHGSQRLSQRPLPPGLRQPGGGIGGTTSLDRYRLYELAMSPKRVIAYLRSHPIPGTTSNGAGSTSQGKHVLTRSIGFVPAHLEWGIASVQISDTVVAARGGHSLLRTDVSVSWFPARSAAEHLTASHFTKATVTVRISQAHGRTIRRSFTSAAAIRKIARLLNGLPASPGGVYSCPLILRTYQVVLTPKAGQPQVVISHLGCSQDGITVGTQAQPALQDFGALPNLLDRLLHLHPAKLRPAGIRH